MVQPLTPKTESEIIYPDSDGQPMADNTKQFRWIVVIKENLELLFADRPDVFVAGDLLWYPVRGDNTVCQAPDAMVVFGRPKGDRGSYKQWEEDNIAPQVVFEILSPGNRLSAMAKKLKFYEQYGVQEYYVYDPDDVDLIGWIRSGEHFEVVEETAGWVSPLLGIRFEMTPNMLEIYRPDGQKFLSYLELAQARDQAAQERDQAAQERDQALALLESERQRNDRLAERLRELGIDPNQLSE